MLALRCLAKPEPGCRRAPCGPRRRTKFTYGPRTPRSPLPRTPWTVRGPPPGAKLPWYLRDVPPVREQLPELDVVTYEGKQYRVPWLAKPDLPKWERGWRDPFHDGGPRLEEMPGYHEHRPCYICHRRTRLLEGLKQALWLTKTKLIQGLPPQILDIMNDTAHQLENQDERVQNAISHARFWVNTDVDIADETYSPVLLEDLLHLCRTMTTKYPSLAKRMMTQECRVAAAWERESILLQVRGPGGKLLNAVKPLKPIASKDEILATENHTLETFYPVAPTIDLQEVNVYETKNDSGFREGYPYLYPHSIYFPICNKFRMRPEHLRASMMMFAFGNALAKAKQLYGIPAGIHGYQPDTFKKFLAFYLHGVV